MNGRVTRGKGLLENYLAKKRAKKADSLILDNQRKGRILDIGCGSYPYFLAKTNFKEKFGIDPSVGNVGNEKIILKKIKVDESKLSFDKDYFDVVTMLAVIEHIEFEKLPAVLEEINRVLKKRGILIITTPAHWTETLLHLMGKVGLISAEEINEHKYNYQRLGIEGILERSGFEKKNTRSGFFELYANMWFSAIK